MLDEKNELEENSTYPDFSQEISAPVWKNDSVCLEPLDALSEWKESLERDFNIWLDELPEIPAVQPQSEEPDLFSFYQELSALRNEVRKGGRRNQEVLGRFGDSLSGFQETVKNIQDRMLESDEEKNGADTQSGRELFLSLTGVFERMERLKERLGVQPVKSLFNDYNNWERAWNKFQEGFDIAFSHLDELLKKEGIARIETVGKPFDPTRMAALSVEYGTSHPEDTVIQEVSPGFLFHGKVLKMAEVKIAKTKKKGARGWKRLWELIWEPLIRKFRI